MRVVYLSYLLSVCMLLNACGSTGEPYVSPLESFITGCLEHYNTFLPASNSDSMEVYWYSYKDGRPYKPPEKQMIVPLSLNQPTYYPHSFSIWDSLILLRIDYGMGFEWMKGIPSYSLATIDDSSKKYLQGLIIMGNHRTYEVFGVYEYNECRLSVELEDFLLYESKEEWDGLAHPMNWQSAIRQWDQVRNDSAAGTRLDSLTFHDWDCEKIREEVTRLVEQESR